MTNNSEQKTTEKRLTFLNNNGIMLKLKRCVAQFGRALRSGRRGRWFKSSRIDSLAGALLIHSRVGSFYINVYCWWMAFEVSFIICRCGSMVEHQPSKLKTWVRFPSPAFWIRFRIFFLCFFIPWELFHVYIELQKDITVYGQTAVNGNKKEGMKLFLPALWYAPRLLQPFFITAPLRT